MDAAAISRPAVASTPPSIGGPSGDAVDRDSARSPVTATLTATAILGGKAKGMLIDRPRILAALPHARSQGKLGKWALELATAKPTNDVVPISGGTIRLAGRTLTTQGWRTAYQLSNGVGLGLLGVSMLYGFPNLVEGWRDGGGADGLLETRQGRTGVLASVGNAVGLGVLGAAFLRAPAGPGRVMAVLRDPIHSATPMVLLRVAVGVPVTLNELGYLDFLEPQHATGDPWRNALDTTSRHLDTAREVVGLGADG